MPLSNSQFPKPAPHAEGVEIGKDYENKVSSLLVVLAKREGTQEPYTYKFLSSAYTGNPTTTNNTYTICFQNKEALYDYAGTTGGNKFMYLHTAILRKE